MLTLTKIPALLVAACLAGVYGQSTSIQWQTVCTPNSNNQISMNWTVTRGPSGNSPNVFWFPDTCILYVQPCSVNSCFDNHPIVTIEMTLPNSFDLVGGTFVQNGRPRVRNAQGGQTTAVGHADDCNTGGANTQWGQFRTDHDGISVFGTPDRVIYGGCGANTNFPVWSLQIQPAQSVNMGRVLRFESMQSVQNEVVEFNLAGLRVATQPTPPPSMAPTFADCSTYSSQSSCIASGINRCTWNVTSSGCVPIHTSLVSLQRDIARLQAASSTSGNTQSLLRINQLESRISTLQSNLDAALSTITNAVSQVPAPTTVQSNGQSPAVGVVSNELHVQGNGMPIKLDSSCGTVDPCQILAALDALKNL